MRFSPRPVLVAFSVGLLFIACSSESDSVVTETPSTVDTAVTAETTAVFNDADVLFSQGMIPHHRQAIAMADMALSPDAQASPEVQALATQIQGAQDPEIAQMTRLLESWNQPLEMDGMEGMEGMDDLEGMEGMDGMMSAEDMASLAALSNSDFDAAWTAAMVAHHEGAVSMSQTVKATGSNPEIFALADAIITGQQAEIEQMRAFTTS